MGLGDREDVEKLGDVEGGRTMVGMSCSREDSIFKKEEYASRFDRLIKYRTNSIKGYYPFKRDRNTVTPLQKNY